MIHRPIKPIAILTAGALAISAGLLIAGPLNPPAGPVAPTYKTLAEVEPRIAINAANTPGDADSSFQITAPGSYYLTGNIFGASGKHGIEVVISGVTIDLNGFSMLGSFGSLDGISLTAARNSISIKNGSIIAWSGDGIDLASGTHARIADLCLTANTGAGVIVGDLALITGCTAQGNADGIRARDTASIIHCSAMDNLQSGIRTNSGAAVTDCTAWFNGAAGFQIGAASNISQCSAGWNTGDGIMLWVGASARDNTCWGNDGAGIRAPALSGEILIESNHCVSNGTGILVQTADNIIVRNRCSANTTNWNIVTGNAVAPIVSAATNAVPIIGNSYAGNLGSTDPNANFTY
jgi:hypothetical protein